MKNKGIKKIIALTVMLFAITNIAACSNENNTGESESKNSGAIETDERGYEIGHDEDYYEDDEVEIDESNLEPLAIACTNDAGGMSIGNLNSAEYSDKFLNEYDVKMCDDIDAVITEFTNKNAEIAIMPVDTAAKLYNESDEKICVLNICALGTFYCVTSDETIDDIDKLSEKTVYLYESGDTLLCAFNYLLDQFKIEDVEIIDTGNISDIYNQIENDPNTIAIVSQPYAASIVNKYEGYDYGFPVSNEWEYLGDASDLIGAVSVCYTSYYDENSDMINAYIKDHAAAYEILNTDSDTSVKNLVSLGICEDDKEAEDALTMCNICSYSGGDIDLTLSMFLDILYTSMPEIIGNNMPGRDFYPR